MQGLSIPLPLSTHFPSVLVTARNRRLERMKPRKTWVDQGSPRQGVRLFQTCLMWRDMDQLSFIALRHVVASEVIVGGKSRFALYGLSPGHIVTG